MAQKVRKKLGEMLLEDGKIKEEDLARALTEQKKYGERLGEILVKMELLPEKEIIETISRQLKIPFVRLEDREIPDTVLRLVPGDLVKNNLVLPLDRNQNVLKLAMVDPLDINAMDEISRSLKMEIEPYIVSEGDLKRALEKYYNLKTIVEETLEKIKEKSDVTFEKPDEEKADHVSLDMVEEEPVVRFVNSLLTQAIIDSASDIHVEAEEKRMRVRIRVDGRLREISSPEKKMFLPIISRIKILGGMDIAKTRIPQDGRFNMKDGRKEVGVRVSTFPTIHGEKAVLRLLDKSAALYGIDKLGLLPDDEEKIRKVLKRPYGFILATGPTGSGKSTTLYAILNAINSVEKNIITIEDPVEYVLEGVAQAQINPKAGLTFDSGLRSILRQDPDVIMVGEIRDRETASTAVHSALTGHIVLSTLHTNDAVGAVTRLVEMGIESFLVASSVSCVIGQRLLRKICEDCKESYHPPRAVIESIEGGEETILFRGRGCSSCRGAGYKGRTGVYEVLVADDEIRELVVNSAPQDAIRKAAIEKGMRLIRDDAIKKAVLGITTLEEALTVTQTE